VLEATLMNSCVSAPVISPPLVTSEKKPGEAHACRFRAIVPLEELGQDLKTTASTPNFAWVAPNDCTDMEGCGIAAGDAFLKTELTQIMNSPAWRTQRSLAIITFDEDATDGQRPAQRVPTLVVASQGVRPGYSDPARYTHYSLLRTVEAALGLGTLTANDRYAPAFNNIFKTTKTLSPERTLGSGRQAPRAPRGRGRPRAGATGHRGRQVRRGRPARADGAGGGRREVTGPFGMTRFFGFDRLDVTGGQRCLRFRLITGMLWP